MILVGLEGFVIGAIAAQAAKPRCSMTINYDVNEEGQVISYKAPNGEVYKIPRWSYSRFRKYVATEYGSDYILKLARWKSP